MDFYLILIPLRIPATEQTHLCWYWAFLMWQACVEYTDVLYRNKMFTTKSFQFIM